MITAARQKVRRSTLLIELCGSCPTAQFISAPTPLSLLHRLPRCCSVPPCFSYCGWVPGRRKDQGVCRAYRALIDNDFWKVEPVLGQISIASTCLSHPSSPNFATLVTIRKPSFFTPFFDNNTMATVYKSLNKANGSKDEESNGRGAPRKNKQRVLALSSRGVTYR